MAQTVILKSNRYGINLILDKDIEFKQLLLDIEQKFKEADGFFKGAKMALSFEGRELSLDEECQILEAISVNSSLQVTCIIDNDPEKEQAVKMVLEKQAQEETEPIRNNNAGEFYKGTLRSGQLLECEGSIVIIGDVNPGAKVISKGNIVVLGALKGNAYAGASGNNYAFVAAMEMDPVQVKIGDIIARSSDKRPFLPRPKKKKKEDVVVEPQVAIVKNGNIYIEPITKGLLNNL